MELIEPKVEIWEQPKGIEGIYKQIERAGRVCYKSEDHTTEDSAKPFVERMSDCFDKITGGSDCDLWWFVEKKMKYNETRAMLNGKRY